MKVLFLEQHPSGFPLSWDQTVLALWVGFALGFYLSPFEHIPVFFSGFLGDFIHLFVWGWWLDFALCGVFVGAGVEISVGVA